MSRGSKAHERCVTRGSIFAFIRPASVITWKLPPGIRHHNTGIPANRAGSVVIKSSSWFSLRLTMAKVPVSLKASKPCSCYKTLSSIARFYALPVTSPIFKAPEDTHKISAPPPLLSSTSSYPLLYIIWTFSLKNGIKNKQKAIRNKKPNKV